MFFDLQMYIYTFFFLSLMILVDFFLYLEMQAEVGFLGRLSHPNLVKLLGYCLEDQELLLVYEFMQRGSLENHLFRRKTNLSLDQNKISKINKLAMQWYIDC